MLRTALLNEIDSLINATNYFKPNDFLIENSNNKEIYTLHITYRFDPKFNLTAWIPNQKTKEKDGYSEEFRISATISPGEIVEKEKTSYNGKRELFNGIGEWLSRVKAELQAMPAFREVRSQKSQIDNILKQFDEMQDDYFTIEEAELLKNRLDELEKTLIENLKSNLEDKKDLQTKLQNLQKDFEVLKETLNSSRKKGWAGSFVVRILEWTKDPTNRKVLTTGADVAKDLLLEAGKQINGQQ